MKKFVYYSVLIATFIVLWALMITIFVVLEKFGYKARGVLFGVGFAVILGIMGGIKPCLKNKLEKKYGK